MQYRKAREYAEDVAADILEHYDIEDVGNMLDAKLAAGEEKYGDLDRSMAFEQFQQIVRRLKHHEHHFMKQGRKKT